MNNDHFGLQNHMVVEDEYRPRKPRLSFDMRRGYPVPMITDVTAEEIEAMHVQTLRRQAALEQSLRITQKNANDMFDAEMNQCEPQRKPK